MRLHGLIKFIYCIKCYLAIKSANKLFFKLAIYLIYTNHLTFWPNTYAYCKKLRKCDFNFLTEWFYPVFKKTILTGQYVDRSICRSHIDRWTSQYPILAYTTWHDLNQSQPHISIRGITIILSTSKTVHRILTADRTTECAGTSVPSGRTTKTSHRKLSRWYLYKVLEISRTCSAEWSILSPLSTSHQPDKCKIHSRFKSLLRDLAIVLCE